MCEISLIKVIKIFILQICRCCSTTNELRSKLNVSVTTTKKHKHISQYGVAETIHSVHVQTLSVSVFSVNFSGLVWSALWMFACAPTFKIIFIK